MGAQNVNLPSHLWAALDEMSRDGATAPEALMEQAVEQFVALQGYVVPTTLPPPVNEGQRSLQDDDDDLGLARTQARSALTPELARELLASPVATDVSASHKVGASPPVLTGIGPTHVPVAKSNVEPAVPSKPRPEPAPTPAAPPAPAAKAKPPVEAPRPPADPQWVKRSPLSDADEERAAARERMVAIDADVAKLTIERPTKTPLGQEQEEEE